MAKRPIIIQVKETKKDKDDKLRRFKRAKNTACVCPKCKKRGNKPTFVPTSKILGQYQHFYNQCRYCGTEWQVNL